MALFDVDFPEDFFSDLLDTEFSEIAEEALSEAAPMLVDSMKNYCAGVIQHDGDSELVNSFKSNKPKRAKTDAWIVNVNPKGYSSTKMYTAVDSKGKKTHRKYPVSNALKAIWKEYGIPGRQPPKPFIASACNSVRGSVMAKMQEVFNRKVGVK